MNSDWALNEAELELVGRFRELFKRKSMKISVEPGTSLLKIIMELGDAIGVDLRSEFIGPDGKPMDESSLIIVNGRVVDLTRISEQIVKPGDRIVLAPSVAGGG
ncbi:MAG: MoaD/ThiS family protein [Thermoproteota archaeon]